MRTKNGILNIGLLISSILAFMLSLPFSISLEESSFVSRSFSNKFIGIGDEIEVRIQLKTASGSNVSLYVIQEIVPDGWLITSENSDERLNNTLIWKFSGNFTPSKTFSYRAKPLKEGVYSFNGIYFLAGNEFLQSIEGDQIVVANIPGKICPPSSKTAISPTLLYGLGLVILISFLIALIKIKGIQARIEKINGHFGKIIKYAKDARDKLNK